MSDIVLEKQSISPRPLKMISKSTNSEDRTFAQQKCKIEQNMILPLSNITAKGTKLK